MRKLRKKFKRPKVSWDSELILENKKLRNEYGLRRRTEILISQEKIRAFRRRARDLIAQKDEMKEKILIDRLAKLGLLTGSGKGLDDVLALTIRNVLERRLQTLLLRKGLASSPMHARQLIVHGHVNVAGRRNKFPAYIVSVDEEATIELRNEKPMPKKAKSAVEQKAELLEAAHPEAAGKVKSESVKAVKGDS